jgi:hypothetical protein
MLAKSPKATLYTEGSGDFVASITAPIASGWSDRCRVGFAPTGDSRLFTRSTKAFARSVQKLNSCGLPIVVIEHSSESSTSLHSSAGCYCGVCPHDEAVVEALVVPLPMVMHDELSNRVS